MIGIRMTGLVLLLSLATPCLAQERLVHVPQSWNSVSELKDHDGIAWYRAAVEIPKAWEGENLELALGQIDDAEETFFNGEQVGATAGWNRNRSYEVPEIIVKFGAWNTISLRVNDTGGNGGIWQGRQLISSSKGAISLQGAWFIDTNDVPTSEDSARAKTWQFQET